MGKLILGNQLVIMVMLKALANSERSKGISTIRLETQIQETDSYLDRDGYYAEQRLKNLGF